MLYFCSTDEIMRVLPSASRFAKEFDDCRKQVTADMNAYMRRTLDFAENVVETFDSNDISSGGSISVWTEKKNLDPNSVIVDYHPRRIFDIDTVVSPDDVIVSAEKGKIMIHTFMRKGTGTIRIKYNGGFKAIGATDVMDAPANVRAAAIAECSYRLDKLLNVNVGNSEDNNGRTKSAQRKLMGGLLFETAQTLTPFRRTFGAIA